MTTSNVNYIISDFFIDVTKVQPHILTNYLTK